MKTLLKSMRIPVSLSNDNSGRSQHWSRAAARKSCFVGVITLTQGRVKTFQEPVSLRVVRVLGPKQKLWDADSIGRGSAKELIDALVGCGWLVDDGPKYVTEVAYAQDDSQRDKGPAVIVEFYQC